MVNSQQYVAVTAYPRLHFGLIDLADATLRRYGGAGVAVSAPRTVVEAERSNWSEVIGLETLDAPLRRAVEELLQRLEPLLSDQSARVTLCEHAPQHVGFGSTTSIMLAIIASLNRLFQLGLDRPTIQDLSGRGGTSGIGINTFFTGGFVTDCGQPLSEGPFKPSSKASGHTPSPVAVRAPIPSGWRFALMLTEGNRVNAARELEFFSTNTPLHNHEVLRTLALVYHCVVPSMLSGDIQGLGHALRCMHETGFKAREVGAQTENVKELLHQIQAIDAVAGGMSSLGPLVYAIYDERDQKAKNQILYSASRLGADVIGFARGRNRGTQAMVVRQ